MEIRDFDASLAGEATDCYNRITAGLHHCYPTTTDRVLGIIEARDAGSGLRDAGAWVVVDGGRVVGLAHAALDDGVEDLAGPRGSIRLFGYEPGHRLAGQALLGAVEARLSGEGVPEIVAFHQDHRWPCFHFDHSYLTDRLAHIEGLLGMNGYTRCAGEVYLDWPDLAPPEIPPCAADLRVEPEALGGGSRRPNFVLRAHLGDELAAECWNASCGVSAPDSPAEDWALTTWLHVEEAHRGKRLGAHLLAHALRYMREIGYRHASISTSLTNYRAQLFYSNFGYRQSDWTYAWSRKLEEG